MRSDLYELVENTEVDYLGLNSTALHALWAIHGLGALDHPVDEVRKSENNLKIRTLCSIIYLSSTRTSVRFPATGERCGAQWW